MNLEAPMEEFGPPDENSIDYASYMEKSLQLINDEAGFTRIKNELENTMLPIAQKTLSSLEVLIAHKIVVQDEEDADFIDVLDTLKLHLDVFLTGKEVSKTGEIQNSKSVVEKSEEALEQATIYIEKFGFSNVANMVIALNKLKESNREIDNIFFEILDEIRNKIGVFLTNQES